MSLTLGCPAQATCCTHLDVKVSQHGSSTTLSNNCLKTPGLQVDHSVVGWVQPQALLLQHGTLADLGKHPRTALSGGREQRPCQQGSHTTARWCSYQSLYAQRQQLRAYGQATGLSMHARACGVGAMHNCWRINCTCRAVTMAVC